MSETPIPAGRELDALIAEKVMGAAPARRGFHRPDPLYSTSIAAAWRVVEVLESHGWNATVRRTWDGYSCEFDNMAQTHSASVDPREGNVALAICRAALAALTPTPETP